MLIRYVDIFLPLTSWHDVFLYQISPKGWDQMSWAISPILLNQKEHFLFISWWPCKFAAILKFFMCMSVLPACMPVHQLLALHLWRPKTGHWVPWKWLSNHVSINIIPYERVASSLNCWAKTIFKEGLRRWLSEYESLLYKHGNLCSDTQKSCRKPGLVCLTPELWWGIREPLWLAEWQPSQKWQTPGSRKTLFQGVLVENHIGRHLKCSPLTSAHVHVNLHIHKHICTTHTHRHMCMHNNWKIWHCIKHHF